MKIHVQKFLVLIACATKTPAIAQNQTQLEESKSCCLMLLNGCSEGPSPVVGGTAGSLVVGGIPIPDFVPRRWRTRQYLLQKEDH
jgi:hypothetical protein